MTANLPIRNAPAIMNGWSIEATLPKPDEIAALAGLLAPGAELFLSTLPHVSLDQQIETARAVCDHGLVPVLHIAVRYFASRTELVGYLTRANREAQIDRFLVIAGDLDRPRGAFDSALSLIVSGLLADYGARRIGVAGYPEGHPKIAAAVLERALDDKLRAIRAAGLDAQIVTQFSFDPSAIGAWIANVRSRWPDVPIRVGLAGPASARTLLKFALRCGVVTPRQGFGRKLATANRLLRTESPQAIIEALAARPDLQRSGGGVATHFFSFGGMKRTVEWVGETWPDSTAAPSALPSKPRSGT